jgi:catechol 2,3-dioxygenase-like lactoylglutathione lyase family enzyme
MSDRMNISGIGQIAIAITDLDKAVYFYEKILKLEKLFAVPPNLAFYNCGGVRLMLTTVQGPEQDHRTSVIYYKVTDVETIFDELQALQVDIERAPGMVAKMEDHELWIGFIRDPDRNLIGLMEEKPLKAES